MANPAELAPADGAWDEAFLRVESYLRAHQIESRILLNQLTSEIITAARHAAPDQQGVEPVTLAMRIAHAHIGAWLVSALREGDWSDERFRARGRLALVMSDVPRRWPHLFLSAAPVPDELARAMAEARLQPGPEVRLSTMPPAPLEFPLAENAQSRLQTFHRSSFFRAATSWFLIVGILGAAWFASH